ncbi:hypothetical protein AEAC466_10730 [Asticcacaulis sp. AC466]|nr:hypothetical protein AEAC466_10730 [Asticcacaulis sp. AC466]
MKGAAGFTLNNQPSAHQFGRCHRVQAIAVKPALNSGIRFGGKGKIPVGGKVEQYDATVSDASINIRSQSKFHADNHLKDKERAALSTLPHLFSHG